MEADGTGGYKIWTRAVPEEGEANAAVLKLLAKEIGVSARSLILRHGASSRSKIIEVVD